MIFTRRHVLRGPREQIVTKLCTLINDTYVIVCAKFGGNRFTDYLLTVV